MAQQAIVIDEEELVAAGRESLWAFLQVFFAHYEQVMGEDFGAEKMQLLTGDQHALNSFRLLIDFLEEGTFVALIQNGYGSYLFDNPFAKALRLYGAKKMSNLVYKAKRVFDENRAGLEPPVATDEDFQRLFDTYQPLFDPIEEEIEKNLPEAVEAVATYVDEHIEKFAEVRK